MARTPNFEVSTNTTANLLRICLNGAIDAKCMKACVDEVARQLPTLHTNFKSFTDLSGIQSMDTDCVPEVERMMDLCRDKGVSTVVRLIPKHSKDVGFNILSFFHYPKKVHIVTCATAAEAERALAD
jgi:ABC-type transporter Mla MlaB component